MQAIRLLVVRIEIGLCWSISERPIQIKAACCRYRQDNKHRQKKVYVEDDAKKADHALELTVIRNETATPAKNLIL